MKGVATQQKGGLPLTKRHSPVGVGGHWQFTRVAPSSQPLGFGAQSLWDSYWEYPKGIGVKVGVIVNFKHARLEWRRIVLSENSRSFASVRG